MKSLRKKYPTADIQKGYTWNTLRINSNIAKLIPYDIEDPDDIGRAKKAFEVERYVYSKLPAWWGVRLVDSYIDGNVFVIIITEYKHCKVPSLSPSAFADVEKQLRWLHSHRIAHNDLEMKNILVSCDQKHAIIIDFEKSVLNASPDLMAADKGRLVGHRRSGGRRRATRKKRIT